MKTNLLKSIFISLILLVGATNAWAYNYGGTNVYYYFANTGSWSNVYLYIWNSNNTWNTDFTLNKIANTKVYYHKWSSAYNDNGGILFRASTANWNNKTGDIKANYTSHTSWVHDNTTGKTDLSNINRQAQVAVKLSTGGNYTQTANANCVAKVSGYTVVAGNSSATAKNASTSGSSATASISAAYGSTITYTATAGTGYTFKGFSTSNSTSLPASPSASGKTATASGYGSTNNSTYYAYFKANSYTVKFDANGGTTGSMSNQSHTYGVSKALTANAFTKTGYNFAGWNTKADGTGTSYTDKQSVSNLSSTDGGSVTLYAQWELATYTITYNNLKGATHTNPATYTINSATITFTAPTSTPTGYTFANWSPASIVTGSTGNKTVDAQWTANTYTVTLNQEEATTGGTTSVTATYDAAMPSITPPTRTGYTFNGYYDATSDGTQYYEADGSSARTWDKTSNTTLYAQWTINQYTIKYLVNSGTGTGTIAINQETATQSGTLTADYNTTHTLTATPAKNYRVAGWYDESDQLLQGGAEAEEVATYTITSLASDMTVKVVFAEANEVPSEVVVSSTIGGTVSPTGTATVLNRTPSTFTATPNPGYRFDHWSYDGGVEFVSENNTNEQGSITITATAAGTLTANFVRVYTVKYYATPIAAGIVTAKVGENTFTSGDALDARTEITFTETPANKECNFIGWVDGAGDTLSTEPTYIHTVEDDITIKGIFKINQYTLTFSAGDGGHVSATANNSAIASPATLDYNTSVTLTAEPSANCRFLGWYDGNTQYSSNAVYTTTLTANKNLEAHFQKGTTIFFKPVDYWKEADARFAVYTWGTSVDDKWIEFEDYGCNEDIFTADIPAGYTGFKIVRLKPASADGYESDGDGLNWDNRWAETVNLTIPTGNKNLYDMTVTKTSTKLYFTPHDNWKKDNARFAAYFFENGNKWVDLTHHNDGIYACEKPSGYTKVIFGRMNPGTKDNNFNDGVKWNKTGDLTLPTNGQNHYILTGGEWDGVTGEWHTAWDDRQWTTYAAPSYNLTIQSTANGTVAVSKVGGAALATNATIKLGDKITITFTPNDGHELSNYLINYASETETDGVYTVCGPTKIIAEFDLIAPSRTVYLRPNEDWLRDNPIMAAYAYKSTNDKAYRWYVMNTTDDDYTGAYSCKIPSEYDKIIFVRLNPNGSNTTNDGFNWQNMWNQTKALTIIDKDNDATNDKKMRFAIGDKIETSGEDYGRYDGTWEENTPIWGMIANFNDWKAENAVFMGYPGKLNTVPPFTPQHAFKLYNFIYTDGKYFGNAGTMKRENSEQWWTMDVNEQANCQMKLDAKGDYIYQLRFLTVGPELRKQISVTYPAEEMYYLNYVEGNRWSYAISNTSDNTKSDKVSFFVSQGTATIKLTDASKAEKATKTFNIPEAGVYNFTLQHGPTPSISTELEKYTGNYYIRTDAAAGGWNAYKQTGNKMTYSSYADRSQNFNHYFCRWVENSQSSYANVKFCIANDYSHAISDELNGDEIIDKTDIPTGCIPNKANIRFGWNSKTNAVSRAYIAGSSNASDRFLVLTGNEYLLDIAGKSIPVGTGDRNGLKEHELIFSDKQNWIYQLDVQANNQTSISLTAEYNGKVQTFFGNAKSAAEGEPMLVDVANKYHKVRMIYDFKTNNLIAAWLLDPTQNVEATHVESNMLIIREDQGVANQINFASNGNQDMYINTAYAVMTFTKEWVKGANTRDRSEYWVSFPFDVNLSDVFGFSEYGDQWIMLLYDGAARAKEGYWAESKGFWKYITNRNYTLQAGVGYVLKLNLNKMDFPNNSTDASLFFPSQGIPTVINAEPTQITVPAHQCTIERDNRNIYDSHWNLIGVPGYANLDNLKVGTLNQNVTIENEARNLAFYYAYDAANNDYNTELATATFKNMHAYMVQYAGELAWTNIQETPAQLAARHNSDAEPEKAIFRLELAQGEEKADQTFVQMQQEGATAEFDMNVDMTKIINSGANIYTLVGTDRIQTAGNVLPFKETTVAVGVDIATAGEYTFRMPDGTEDMVVELIDYETNTTTNLLLDDYTVYLPTGSNETRFALSIKPEKTATSIESTTTPSDSNIRKFIIDGKLYLQKDGMLYDAQGKLVR